MDFNRFKIFGFIYAKKRRDRTSIIFGIFYACHSASWLYKADVYRKRKMFGIMQCLFAAMLGLYCLNYITAFIPLAIIIVLEHILFAITITTIVVEGFIRIHENKNVKLFRVLSGYSIFSICSIIAIVFYYIGLEFEYSIS